MTRSLRSAAVLAAAILLVLTGCGSPAPAPSAPATASDTPTPSTPPTPSTTPTPAAPSIDDSERAAIVAGVEAGDPAAIGPYFADTVTYIIASSECCGPVSAADATGELISYTGSSSGWASPLDTAYLDQMRMSPYYADLVPADVISMKAASDDLVVILGVSGERITSVLVGHRDVLLFE
jgi:hypothetical protein